jgi:hypothetical protein
MEKREKEAIEKKGKKKCPLNFILIKTTKRIQLFEKNST